MNRVLYFLLGVAATVVVTGLTRHRGNSAAETFITRAGTITDPRTNWQVIVDPTSGRHTLSQGSSLIAPMWAMKPGWFVFVENEDRVWSYNGVDQLLLFVAGTGPETGAFGPDNAPLPVPDPVVRRIGEHEIGQIAETGRAARERLGIGPAR